MSFTLGFVGVLILLLFQAIDFHPIDIVRPYFTRPQVSTVQKTIDTRLNQIKNNFKVKKPVHMVAQAHADSELSQAAAYGGVDFESGEVLVSNNIDKRLPIASVTKVMSAIVTLDLANPDEQVTITRKASRAIPTKIGVVTGEQMTFKELLTASLLTSANDATQALADGIDAKYGKGTFVAAMNEKAHVIGLKNSSFANPQGFDNPENYSTVEDLAILTHYALVNYPIIGEIVAKDYDFLPENSTHKQFDLYNWNGLLDVYPDTIGMKIGNTGDAGYTTVVVSSRGGNKIISVVLGAPVIAERDLWASQVLDESYEKGYSLEPINVTREMLSEKYSTWKYFN